MKLSTAATALSAVVGLSACTMTAAAADTPVPADAPPHIADVLTDDGRLIPNWSRDLTNSASCADVAGTPYMDNPVKEGFPPMLDADRDGISCESNGDDDAARAVAIDPWEGSGIPLQEGYVFPNCDTAYAGGNSYPFPVWFPFSAAVLDGDGDGMACETNGDDAASFTGVVHPVPLAGGEVLPGTGSPETPVESAPAEPTPAESAPTTPPTAAAPATAPTAAVTAAPAPVAPVPVASAPEAAAPAAQAPASAAPAAPAVPAAEASAPAAKGSQVETVPVGGADTGASSKGWTGAFAGGALAALAGAGMLLRRAMKR